MSGGDFNARIERAHQATDDIGQCRQTKKNTNGIEVSRFLKHNQMKMSNSRVKSQICSGLDTACKREKSPPRLNSAMGGCRKDTEVHVCAGGAGNTDHYPT